MQVVGKFLQLEGTNRTKKLSSCEDADLFLRSAYNRYYYSMQSLAVKEVRFWVEPSTQIKHKNLPELFRTKVAKVIKNEVASANRIGDYKFVNLLKAAERAALDLSQMIELGYKIRCIADYKLDISVDLSKNSVALGGTNIQQAFEWTEKSSKLIETIKNVRLTLNAT